MSSKSLAVDTHFFLVGSQLSLNPVLLVWTKLDQISVIWESKLWEFVFFCASPLFTFVTCFGQSGHVVGLVASSFPFCGLVSFCFLRPAIVADGALIFSDNFCHSVTIDH